jgi:hypothetical protein
MNLRYVDKPFDLDSSDWQNNKSRVRALTFSSALDGKLNIIFDELWLLSLLQGCQKLESLTLRHAYSLGYFFRRVRFPKLRFLSVRQSSRPYRAFPHFLETHKDTLVSVTCEKTRLTDFPGWADNADLYSGHPTWFNVFDIMLKMPLLSELDLSVLRQDYDITGNQPRAEGVSYEDEVPKTLSNTWVVAYGDEIGLKLGPAIAQSVYVGNKTDIIKTRCGRELFKEWKVWFPETD